MPDHPEDVGRDGCQLQRRPMIAKHLYQFGDDADGKAETSAQYLQLTALTPLPVGCRQHRKGIVRRNIACVLDVARDGVEAAPHELFAGIQGVVEIENQAVAPSARADRLVRQAVPVVKAAAKRRRHR